MAECPPNNPVVPAASPDFRGWMRHVLLVDLETTVEGRLREVGAVLGDESFRGGANDGLARLDVFARRAGFVLGHNIGDHDLDVIRRAVPGHPVLALPVLDTLVLSPIAFPENPYHRLVKAHKLVRESVNDPVADARQAGTLFADEWNALAALRIHSPALFELLHFLLGTSDAGDATTSEGYDRMFAALGGTRPDSTRAAELARVQLDGRACVAHARDTALFATTAGRRTLAHAFAWLRVAGGNSVLPAWVRHRFPEILPLLDRWRQGPCGLPECAYCARDFDARAHLRAHFGFEDFRAEPKGPRGEPLQREIVEAGLRGESLLAILPTGGGKSLCYQLPAIVRNRRRGTLTVVVSPLQALMKDQVDGLVRRTGTPSAAALYGMLTMPERGDVLRRLVLGDLAILYVSPEQFRNRSFRTAIATREIGCWVFDEAHCLSKWGHDFRPDYLYPARFIREHIDKDTGRRAPIACFTATAKTEVRDEILAHFEKETGRELRLFEGGVERDNLSFRVERTGDSEKAQQIHALLSGSIGNGRAGSAVVFRARRQFAETTAADLLRLGWRAAHFHAGLPASEKKRIQDEFLSGQLDVICATNAFGMGIDKEDVRLVIHADTPGSLENYIQEAGRAGRDGRGADCVLLFDESDCEAQFRLGAMSQLRLADIAGILRSIRRAGRNRDSVVLTTGEILSEDDPDVSIYRGDAGADTKVRTAVAWLDRAGFVKREENVTNVFQARPLVANLAEAESKLAPLDLAPTYRALCLAVLGEIMAADPSEALTIDQLSMLPEVGAYVAVGKGRDGASKPRPADVSATVFKVLDTLANCRVVKRDTLLTALVRHKVAEPSRARLQRSDRMETAMIERLVEAAPDPEGWMPLSLALLNQRLVDDGFESSVPLLIKLLGSIANDGRGFAGTQGSLDLRQDDRNTLRVRVRRSWDDLRTLSERRRRVAAAVLGTIVGKIAENAVASAELLVEFSFEELQDAVDSDLALKGEIHDRNAAIERALLYLHEQNVVELRQGLAVFRSAMTLCLQPARQNSRYLVSDFEPLAEHYKERVLQVHVMARYAQLGLDRIKDALALVLGYFTLGHDQFLRQFLPAPASVLAHPTTVESYRAIVDDLRDPAQIKIVTARADKNILVLAGPGSGKTRTIVHRCAYLLRVERVRPASILMCCFNRAAALQLRSRLGALVGDDSRGVTIQTYHGLALRLLGRSLAARRADDPEPDFAALIPEAVRLLKGETVPAGLEPDEMRDRLLAGFTHILVDEYQDVDETQYELISALAGRTLADPELKLTLLAVGDDDQSIYGFRGANVAFIRRFQHDYDAETHFLVENYRSTRSIIEVSNGLIGANHDRMKTGRPLRIDRGRATHPDGGRFAGLDPWGRGRVSILGLRDARVRGLAVTDEIRRIAKLSPRPWSRFAVLARYRSDLAHVRGALEAAGIPVRWTEGGDALPRLSQIREVHEFLQRLRDRSLGWITASEIGGWAAESAATHGAGNPWVLLLERLVVERHEEAGDGECASTAALEFFLGALDDCKREADVTDGVVLSTVHKAKGTEHDHVVLVGPWSIPANPREIEEERRVLYVGMTRARETLTLVDVPGTPSFVSGLSGDLHRTAPEANRAEAKAAPSIAYTSLGLADVYMDFAASNAPGHSIHAALALLRPGDPVRLAAGSGRAVEIRNAAGAVVGRLSASAAKAWIGRLDAIRSTRVVAVVRRSVHHQSDPGYKSRTGVDAWEVPLLEIAEAT